MIFPMSSIQIFFSVRHFFGCSKFVSGFKSQFLGRLIRSHGSPRRRQRSGILKEIKKDKSLVFLYIPQSQSHKTFFFYIAAFIYLYFPKTLTPVSSQCSYLLYSSACNLLSLGAYKYAFLLKCFFVVVPDTSFSSLQPNIKTMSTCYSVS